MFEFEMGYSPVLIGEAAEWLALETFSFMMGALACVL